jgi:RNA 3'-terminal phosphate cyclase
LHYLIIDGSYGEGGGQIVRTAVSLSAITGKPIQITNIRSKRNNPGLRTQHFSAVKAVADLFHAKVENLKVGADWIRFIPPDYTHPFSLTDYFDYGVTKHESKVPIDAARRMVKEEIVEEKKVKYENVQIIDRASSCVYVPKWVINIESGNNVYTREILAAANTFLMDEIAYCPHEFFARFRSGRKETYAVCERCGGAYCSRHIEKVHNSYFCREHR